MTGRSQRILGLCAAFLAAALAAPAGGTEPGRAETDAGMELRALIRQLDQSREQEQAITGELTALEREAEAISGKLAEAAARIQSRESMITAGEQELERLEGEEQALLASLKQRRAALAELLAGLQRFKSNPPPPLATQADDVLSAVRGAMLFGAIVPALKAEAAELAGHLARLENIRAARVNQLRELASHIDRLSAARGELSGLHARKLALLRSTRGRLAAEQQRARELAEKSKSLQQLLAGLAKERQKDDEGRHSTAEEQERQRLAILNAPRIPFGDLKGRLDFPAQGQRIKEFGQADGFGGHSKGVFIATRKLAQVTAPADGEIEFAGEFRSYGQLLILNVGEGYHVLMAGLGTVTAETGQMVRAGEPVGSMGEAPARGTLIGDRLEDPRPVLYIEFRKLGSAIDPTAWWVGSRKEARR
jgi:septal ring factor EnvC (AmiA/AmiB activator)